MLQLLLILLRAYSLFEQQLFQQHFFLSLLFQERSCCLLPLSFRTEDSSRMKTSDSSWFSSYCERQGYSQDSTKVSSSRVGLVVSAAVWRVVLVISAPRAVAVDVACQSIAVVMVVVSSSAAACQRSCTRHICCSGGSLSVGKSDLASTPSASASTWRFAFAWCSFSKEQTSKDTAQWTSVS